ncbi:hypothetical protein FKP32DRAFT_838384 [Trametes sanguinea]|nr:hypothetical protein FKP32DRAFT_838384 [Trametes sanguinea]
MPVRSADKSGRERRCSLPHTMAGYPGARSESSGAARCPRTPTRHLRCSARTTARRFRTVRPYLRIRHLRGHSTRRRSGGEGRQTTYTRRRRRNGEQLNFRTPKSHQHLRPASDPRRRPSRIPATVVCAVDPRLRSADEGNLDLEGPMAAHSLRVLASP